MTTPADPSTNPTVTVGTYHVFGSGAARTWFRRTRADATEPAAFFAALSAAKKDGGDNGFVGTYEVPSEFMANHGWEADTMYYPPSNDHSSTPQPSKGWLRRDEWLSGGLKALEALIPAFSPGYYCVSDEHTRSIVFVDNEEDHRKAVLDGHKVSYFKDMADGIHEMDFRWGDQSAAAYLLVRAGVKLDYIQGCGDGTPYITASVEQCLADGMLSWSDPRSDTLAAQQEHENDFFATAARLGVKEEYNRLCAAGYSLEGDEAIHTLARKIEGEIVRAKANMRANGDKTGILRRLLKHYRGGMNPLKSLRTEKGGTWSYHQNPPAGLPDGTLIFEGDGWWVSWTPAGPGIVHMATNPTIEELEKQLLPEQAGVGQPGM